VSGEVSVPAEFTYLDARTDRMCPVPAELVWSPKDPHAVTFCFRNRDRTVWLVGRELIVDALTSPAAGEGDVQFWWEDGWPECVGLTLDAPSGHAELLVPREALIELLVLSEPGFRGAVDAWQVKWQGELAEVAS
jgi:hypothetical protein